MSHTPATYTDHCWMNSKIVSDHRATIKFKSKFSWLPAGQPKPSYTSNIGWSHNFDTWSGYIVTTIIPQALCKSITVLHTPLSIKGLHTPKAKPLCHNSHHPLKHWDTCAPATQVQTVCILTSGPVLCITSECVDRQRGRQTHICYTPFVLSNSIS